VAHVSGSPELRIIAPVRENAHDFVIGWRLAAFTGDFRRIAGTARRHRPRTAPCWRRGAGTHGDGPGRQSRRLAAGAVHISMSTISPDLSRHLAEVHARHGQDYVAAPVLGNPDAVRSRTLFVLASGRTAAVERVRPLLERLGQRLFVIGEDVAAANLVKLAGNVLTAITLESMGEVLALLRKGGIDARVGFDVFTNSLFDSRVHRIYGAKILNETYTPPGMVVPLAEKDLRLALAEAERHAVPMPAANLVHARLVEMVARVWGGLDWSALGLLAAREAGLDSAAPADGGRS
jgi:3-hydroxyisobutyrate dehydrogenase-like beta-hydroxyacid dehydrogenase